MSTSNFYGRTRPNTIDGLLPLVLSDFEVDADTVQETTDDDVLIQILKFYWLQIAPQWVHINILVGLACGHLCEELPYL